MSAHTPGPWRVDHTTLAIVRGLITPEDVEAHEISCSNGTVAYLPDDGGVEQLANARLIAAAPELLYTLKALVSLDADPMPYDSATTLAAARAAIAKAEGR